MSEGSNRGFWAVMIPVIVAGVLLVVLIVLNRPTGDAAGSSMAQANLRIALAAAKTFETQGGSYADATPLALGQGEPTLVFIGGDEASNDPNVISVSLLPTLWVGAARSSSGTCYWIRDDIAQGTTFGTSSDCAADRLRTAAGSANGWPSN